MGDITSDLLALIPMFNQPRPVALWLIDAPELKPYILAQLNVEKTRIATSIFCPGLPFYEWWTWAEKENDHKPDLPFLYPECKGLWVEMKNAPHKAISLPGYEHYAMRGLEAIRSRVLCDG